MLKRVGALALMLCGGTAFLYPKAALAQDYRGYYSYTPQYRSDSGYYRGGDRFRDEHREHESRERERREERREQAWREHERSERGWYGAGYYYAPQYYGNPYCPR